jgi:NAD(P)-dependent dehydrogenase (short-subunit alcohol dehydrogenase family)
MSRFELTDKAAIVTGGGGTEHGIGRSIALAFAQAGANVAVVGRHQESLDAVVAEIEGLGRKGLAVVADVTEPDQVTRMVNETKEAFGAVDILANSAGGPTFGKPEEITPEDWRACIELNLNGTFFCCAAAAREMISQGGGKIVNIASSAGIKGEELMAPYAAAKAGIINLTRSLAISWAEHNINVNCVAPGSVQVPDHPIAGVPDEEFDKRKRIQSSDKARPLQLPGQPQDIANAAVFFASHGADLMTGETLVVRGAEWASAYS